MQACCLNKTDFNLSQHTLFHAQGRALAGESLRLFDRIPGGRKVRLDWYLLDTSAEQSAFDGRLLVSVCVSV